MNDDDLRRRFRRDFTSEPIRPLRQQQAPAPQPKPDPPKPTQPKASAPVEAAPASAQPIPTMHIPNHPPAQTVEQSAPVRRRKRAKRVLPLKKILLRLFLMIILAGILFGGYTYWQMRANPVPRATVKSVDYPVLYPTKLPSGYSLDKTSFTTSNDVIIYEADSSISKIVFTVQKRPQNFDYQSFYKQGLGGAASFNTNVGEAAIGKTEGRLLGSFVTDQSWLLISTTSDKVQSSDYRLILNSVKITN